MKTERKNRILRRDKRIKHRIQFNGLNEKKYTKERNYKANANKVQQGKRSEIEIQKANNKYKKRSRKLINLQDRNKFK